jgi:hypothetical protein
MANLVIDFQGHHGNRSAIRGFRTRMPRGQRRISRRNFSTGLLRCMLNCARQGR